MVNKLTPSIRFDGFTDAWEQRKLSDVIKLNGGNAFSSKDSVTNGIPWLKIANVDKNGVDWTTESFLPLEFWDKYSNYQLYKGDYVMALTRPILNNTLKIGRVDKESLLNQRVAKLEFELDKEFTYQLIQKQSTVDKIDNELAGTDPPNLGTKTLANISVKITNNMTEQTKIGNFFKQLDDTIALHQRELDLLKEQKKGFLQKMFPKKDEVVPEIRFEGFTDAWEQRKFSDCFNFPVSTNSLSRALLNYDEGDVKSVHYGDILIKYSTILNIKIDEIPYITDGKLEKYNSNLLKNGDLIFADAAEDETVGKAVEVSGITDENLVAGLHTIVARSKEKKAEFFLGYYINSDVYHRQLLRLMQGSKVSSISKGNLQKTIVSFPKNMEEQSQIGNFFKQLDDTIALHQRKLDLLKELKKGYLQKMFV
ncbi:restriction endonuclease subunit S [Vagococcus sp. CY53-2]|uniref:restriction endonuclease subunit S n=1 Tax=Vagococcus sp. CY53-2 TaxID=2925780 RepID=UPI001F50F201|nr:restriction endonuclease subunit S [Vagococcus sp. CY53-2]MCI0129798.1 restriction endonuclease subunit S [Vagococcus sp. CY53-2]